MKKPIHFRVGRSIHGVNQDGTMSKRNKTVYESITLAKRASRFLQMQKDGALGRGSLVAV